MPPSTAPLQSVKERLLAAVDAIRMREVQYWLVYMLACFAGYFYRLLSSTFYTKHKANDSNFVLYINNF